MVTLSFWYAPRNWHLHYNGLELCLTIARIHRVLLYSVLLYGVLLYSLLSYRVLLCNTLLHRIKNKLHHQNTSKCRVLSLLPTAMCLMHEPPLLRGVVNPWQTKSGTQCGAYGQWIGPFTYQCDSELLHDITSHPAIKQYQQLAYVGQ